MKRVLCLLCAVALTALTACSSGANPSPSAEPSPSASGELSPTPSQSPIPSEEPLQTPSSEPVFRNPLTGLPMEEDTAARKPIAIMLNNLKAAMPQQGNSRADIIYEVLAEGGITRMLGVYHDVSGLGRVGSIRSARLYYLQLAMGHDAVFVHAGGSPEFYETQSAQKLTTIDGVNGPYSGSGIFFRDRDRIAGNHYAYEHSLLSSGENLTSILGKKGLLGDHKAGYTYEMSFAEDGTPAGGSPASDITVRFLANGKSTSFHLGSDGYEVSQYGSAYIDGNDNSTVTVTNVIILQTRCTVLDDAGRIAVDLSSGEGWFACGGKMIPIYWEKGAAEQQLRYYTVDGTPLTLGCGRSYVCIISQTGTVDAN